MRWIKTQDVVKALEHLGWVVLMEDSTKIVLQDTSSSSAPISLARSNEIPEDHLLRVLSGRLEGNATGLVKSLVSDRGPEIGKESVGEVQTDAMYSKVWESPAVKAILNRPKGTPIDLSELRPDEITVLSKGARGVWADHPNITNSVDWVRGIREGLWRGIPEDE